MRQLLNHLRHKKRILFGYLFDFLNGVETNSSISEKSLNFKNDEFYPYIASEPISLKKILKKMSINNEDVFYDIGCGKGRPLLIAEKIGFKKVYGVDISEELIQAAKVNTKNHENITLWLDDAAKSPFPDDVNFLYMSSAFCGDSFTSLLEEIKKSLSRNNRKIRFLYHFPVEHSQLAESGFFRQMVLPIPRYKTSYHLYETTLCASQKSL